MCIRDRTSTVPFFHEKQEKPEKPEKPSVPSNPSTPQKPVPQTGDDPYIFLYGGLLAAALIGGSVFAAVSYTHLDVYKRQLLAAAFLYIWASALTDWR